MTSGERKRGASDGKGLITAPFTFLENISVYFFQEIYRNFSGILLTLQESDHVLRSIEILL